MGFHNQERMERERVPFSTLTAFASLVLLSSDWLVLTLNSRSQERRKIDRGVGSDFHLLHSQMGFEGW